MENVVVDPLISPKVADSMSFLVFGLQNGFVQDKAGIDDAFAYLYPTVPEPIS